MQPDPYSDLGVSSSKKEVHDVVRFLGDGDFPGAFCKAFRSPFAEKNSERLAFMHADGAGTKASLAYLYWKETGDLSVFEALARDAIVMNTDDLLCVGVCGEPMMFASSIARNKNRIPKDVVEAIVRGTQAYLNELNAMGFRMRFAGGETADLGDLVKTLVVDATAFAELPRKSFLDASRIRPGLAIVGLASFGKANYEKEENSGISSNGLTLARHVLLSEVYRQKYPETYAENTDPKLVYRGRFLVEDPLEGSSMTIGKALLSPTRTLLPVFKAIFELVPRERLHGLIHCTGGGLTKCLHFGKGVRYVKDDLLPMPPMYRLLSKSLGRKALYQTFNCGHKMELYADERTAEQVVGVCRDFDLEAKVIGKTESSGSASNQLTIKDDEGAYTFP